ncbi:PqqD family peptide modification chaperone [Franzmannia pantelleriensis]|nr:PqqD family peptide modification chaperone [Halomonas pantelleriensis]
MKLEDSVKRSGEPLVSRVDEDLILFSAEKGMYYGTRAVGNRIWELAAEPRQVSDICEHLMEEFDVDRETCQKEVVAFLESLENEGLIDVGVACHASTSR